MSKILLTQSEPFNLSADTTFLALYAQAVQLVFEPSFAAPASLKIALCPSSLKRHAADQIVPPSYLSSLPSILEHLAWGEISVHWQSPDAIARTEALELCLAALALDWQVELSCADEVLPLLGNEQAGVKGFLSLPMFGLGQLTVTPRASKRLSPTALVLPWQVQPPSSHNRVVI